MKELLIALLTFSICTFAHYKSHKQTKEIAVKEYLEHPENYAIQYVYLKGDTICTDTIITYLK